MGMRAQVKGTIEPPRTQHTRGGVKLPAAHMLRIEEAEGGFLLVRLASDGQFAGDTWHESVQAAQRQAEFEFGITAQDWQGSEK